MIYEVYFVEGMQLKGGDAMATSRKGRQSYKALITASKEMHLHKGS